MILSEDDLYKLTGVKNAVSQRRVLDAQGIPYKQRGAHNIVMEKHVMAWTEGRRVPRIAELDFSHVR